MQPSIELIKASDGTENANVATVQTTRSPGSSTIITDTVVGINPNGFAGSMGTPHTFTDPITSETITVISEASCVDFTGHVDGSNLEIDVIAPGQTDLGSAVGDIIIIRPTTQYGDNIAAVMAVAHEDDGSLLPDAPINSPQATIANITPVGSILDYAGVTAPTGWLLCYGQSLLRADYGDLFTAIGTVFGSVDGTHFNLPDLRGRVVAGQDDMGGSSANRLTAPSTTGSIDGDIFGNTGGQEAHTQVTAELATHTHTQDAHSHALAVTNAAAGGGGGTLVGGGGSTSTNSATATNQNTGSSTPFNVVQPTIILNKIIKY